MKYKSKIECHATSAFKNTNTFERTKKIYARRLSCLLFLIALFFGNTFASWAAGDIEEKYYIVLDEITSEYSRHLEKAFYDYARQHKTNLILHTVDSKDINSKLYILKTGANNQYPVLIFSGYEPQIMKELESQYYNNGEFSVLGYMGSLLLIDEPLTYADNLTYDIPWGIVGFDQNQLAQEILKSVLNSEENVGAVRATSKTSANSNKSQLLILINSNSPDEHSINKGIYDSLQSLITADTSSTASTTLTIDQLYTNQHTNVRIQTEPIQADNAPTLTQDTEKSSDEPAQTIIYNVTNTAIYRATERYIRENPADARNTHSVFAGKTEDGFIIREAFLNMGLHAPQIIGFGLSPEVKNAMLRDEVLLVFDIDYDAYVKNIMEVGKKLYEEVKNNPITDEILYDEEPAPLFPSRDEVVFSVITVRKENL